MFVFGFLLAYLAAQIAAVGGACLTRNPVGIVGFAVMGFAVIGAFEMAVV